MIHTSPVIAPCNRRRADRLTEQMTFSYESEGRTRYGCTINVSDTGARLVLNGRTPRRFQVTMQTLDGPIRMDAVKVWEESLGRTSVVGIRFAS